MISGLPTVNILLCTFNGEKFLAEQLDSIESQSFKNWKIIASDDGSKDATVEILKHYQNLWGHDRLLIMEGPQKGFSMNYLSLACNQKIKADYYSFCDQDDVWLENKLAIAVAQIQNNENPQLPYVYGGRTHYVNETLESCGFSAAFNRPPSFGNALVQSIAGANTIVFNQSAKSVLEKAGMVTVPSHDWWVYLLSTGLGGTFYFDKTPYIKYRQHAQTIMGENQSVKAKMIRLLRFIKGEFKQWGDQNLRAISSVYELLTSENQMLLIDYKKLQDGNWIKRLQLNHKIYRQSLLGNLGLRFALLIKKI